MVKNAAMQMQTNLVVVVELKYEQENVIVHFPAPTNSGEDCALDTFRYIGIF